MGLSNHVKEKELLRLQVESYHMYQVEKMCLDILSDIITEVRFQTEYRFTPINSTHSLWAIEYICPHRAPVPLKYVIYRAYIFYD